MAGKTGTVQHPTLNGQNKDAWMVGYTPSVSTAVWVGTDQSDPIKTAAGRPVFGRMLPGSIWQTFMNGALRGTRRAVLPLRPARHSPGVGTDESDESDDEDSDDEKSDDEDKDDDDSDRDSGDSDRGSDGSGDSDSSGDSGNRSDSGQRLEQRLEQLRGRTPPTTTPSFEEPRIDVPGFRSSNAPVLRTSGQQPLAAGAG